MHRIYTFLLINCLFASFCIAQNDFFHQADSFFQEYAEDGLVDYTALRDNNDLLERLVLQIENFPLKEQDLNTQKAFLINAYNLLVIHSIIQHPKELESVKEIPGFFTSKKHKVNGRMISLDELEKDHLLEDFPDRRLHLCLVCGAKDCPPLPSYAFMPKHLNAQIIAQCREAINDDSFIRIDKQENAIGLNPVFNWYLSDWDNSIDSVLQFIRFYHLQELPASYSSYFYPYDWSLNNFSILSNDRQLQSTSRDLQTFTPSRLLRIGQWDIKLFNNLYTESMFANADGQISEIPRNTFFAGILEVFTGLNTKGTLNAGVRTQFRSSIISRANDQGEVESHSPLEVLLFQDDDFRKRAGWANITPLIKYSPFEQIRGLSFMTGIQFPLVKQAERPVFLTFNSYIWETTVLYDVLLGSRQQWQFYGELGGHYTFGEKGEGFANNSIFIPATIVVSYFPNTSWTLYSLLQHGERLGAGAQNYSQAGIGLKWQLSRSFQLEALYGKFLRGRNSGLGHSFNIGLRYLYL